MQFPVSGALAIHAIVEGEMFAWTDDPCRSTRVLGGDVLLLRASPHHLASSPGRPTVPFASLLDADGVSLRAGPFVGNAAADFCCGAYLFDGDLSRPLIDALPDLVRLRPLAGSPLRVTIDLLVSEMGSDGPGQQALLDRLLDVALVQALRVWFREADDVPGWFRAMEEPALGDALRALHADPARPWTVGELAKTVALSRSSFARRFTEVVGVPPLQYLAQWRVALAKERLRDTDDGLAAIARSVGYGSEFSFASAFKRRVGVAPGRWRAQHAPGRAEAS
ncbi:AraC family transcriptional regulator [Flexivirga lutea]